MNNLKLFRVDVIEDCEEETILVVADSEEEAEMAYANGMLSLQAQIQVRRTVEFEGKQYTGRATTSLGRIFFNRCVPQDLGYVDRTKKENIFKY